jgi:hypothetical protein
MNSHILMLIGSPGHVNAQNYRIQPVILWPRSRCITALRFSLQDQRD